MSDRSVLTQELLSRFQAGMVIPAMPLALDSDRRFDRLHQRALVRYYIDAGAGGLAVGVHTTQFAIREPAIGLFEPVLRYAAHVIDDWCDYRDTSILKVAGVCGRVVQASREAKLARKLGYHAALVSLGTYGSDEPVEVLIEHCRTVAGILPIIGFYLQPAVGGRLLPYAFWRAFAEIEDVIGVKIAPFDRYQTLAVARAVHDAGRADDAGAAQRIALYTGNDDHIVDDLLTPLIFDDTDQRVPLRIVGGLLGQWAVWTRGAVQLLETIQRVWDAGDDVPMGLLRLGAQLTDANGAIFDAAHAFAGCIPGIHEVLRRQGLLAGRWCLDPEERLSPGQLAEIDRVMAAYPRLGDGAFVAQHLSQWLE